MPYPYQIPPMVSGMVGSCGSRSTDIALIRVRDCHPPIVGQTRTMPQVNHFEFVSHPSGQAIAECLLEPEGQGVKWKLSISPGEKCTQRVFVDINQQEEKSVEWVKFVTSEDISHLAEGF